MNQRALVFSTHQQPFMEQPCRCRYEEIPFSWSILDSWCVVGGLPYILDTYRSYRVCYKRRSKTEEEFTPTMESLDTCRIFFIYIHIVPTLKCFHHTT